MLGALRAGVDVLGDSGSISTPMKRSCLCCNDPLSLARVLPASRRRTAHPPVSLLEARFGSREADLGRERERAVASVVYDRVGDRVEFILSHTHLLGTFLPGYNCRSVSCSIKVISHHPPCLNTNSYCHIIVAGFDLGRSHGVRADDLHMGLGPMTCSGGDPGLGPE